MLFSKSLLDFELNKLIIKNIVEVIWKCEYCVGWWMIDFWRILRYNDSVGFFCVDLGGKGRV